MLAQDPTENSELALPIDPIDRIEPTDPIERIEPSEQIDRIELCDLYDQRDVDAAGWSSAGASLTARGV